MKFAIANSPTPLLSTPRFDEVFTCPLPLDHQGLLKPVETVALPGTTLCLLEQVSDHIYRVALDGYPDVPLYTDSRFLKVENSSPLSHKQMPTCAELLERLQALYGLPYIWGGNWHKGIPELLDYYPPEDPLDPHLLKKWTLEGVDCSGLLYEVTSGLTPRNTSQLVHYGEPVAFDELSADKIAKMLHPLDLLVWVGHVVIVLDGATTIESSCPRGGVVTTDLKERLAEILKTRGASFHIRRWLPELLN